MAGEQQKARPWLISSNFTISSAAASENAGWRTSGIAGAYTERLFCPIKLGRQRSFSCVIESQPLPDELEAPGNRECGGCQHDGIELFEQRARRTWLTSIGVAARKNTLVSALVPIDEIALVGFKRNDSSWRISKLLREMRNNSSGF